MLAAQDPTDEIGAAWNLCPPKFEEPRKDSSSVQIGFQLDCLD